jgi:hypothetical protein
MTMLVATLFMALEQQPNPVVPRRAKNSVCTSFHRQAEENNMIKGQSGVENPLYH